MNMYAASGSPWRAPLWREKYLDVYDRIKLSSVLEGDGDGGYHAKTPNYFFCQNGHPSELGHEKIRDLYFTHYTDHEFI